ncbi:MAG TPA: alpha/beta hydrolase fold domain-containing protein, partial [Burkholderiaceae bacterium]|nr:alpha/beta hydrolase fold domain-containing protein [Burkholderiaceae bacterium]
MSDIARVRTVFGGLLPAPGGVRYIAAALGGIAGEWIEAEGRAQDSRADADAALDADASGDVTAAQAGPPILLYIHGGGFVGGSPRTHRPVTAAFALRGLRVYAPDYRLAPEHPYPAALEDVRGAWHALRATHPGATLVLGGDSAGGNLALALMLSLLRDGESLPAAAALFSPSTDLAGASASLVANTGRDPMFNGPALVHLAQAYLGTQGRPDDPLASPLYGDLRALPPLLVHVGADEVLRDDGLRLAAKARKAGVRVELVVWPSVPHGWQLLQRLPEARRSLDAAARFLRVSATQAASAGANVDSIDTRPAENSSAPLHAGIERVDTVIKGAGLSGIGTAAHLQDHCPGHHFTILEARGALGGTWDLFRYPGIRSDSDMHTLGYGFKPWTSDRTIADGAAILDYLRETAVERGIDHQIRYQHRVVAAAWSSQDARWLLTIERGEDKERVQLASRFLLACSGYYRYDAGHAPDFVGRADFRGTLVHPQAWPEGLEVTGRRVVV